MRKFYILGQQRLIRSGMWLVAKGLEHSAKALGYEARSFLLNKEQIGQVPLLRDSDILCVLCHISMWYFGEELKRIGGTLCLYNFSEISVGGEETTRVWWDQFQQAIDACGRSPDVIFNYSPLPISWLRKRGFTAVYLPLGYSPAFEFNPSRSTKKRYDVALLGTQIHDMRSGKLRKEAAVRRWKTLRSLSRRGFRVGHLPGNPKVGGGNPESNITTLLQQNKDLLDTRLWLHVHRRLTHQGFTCIRIVGWGMSNRLCVLSEPCAWAPPFEDGVHWVLAEGKQFFVVARKLLRDPARYIQIGQAGYDFVRTKWNYIDHLQRALEGAGV